MKKAYPNYYLWNCSIFQTDLYKEFETQVLSVLQEEETTFHSTQLMQRAMPELVSTLEAGFNLLTSTMRSMHSSHTTELQKVNQLWSDFFALGNSHFNQNQHSPEAVPCVQQSAPTHAELPANSSTTPLPTYSLNRTIVSVVDVWREYSSGLGGHPSVEFLETTYGTAWRKERKESRFFSRRNELYKAIKEKALLERTSCEEAARRIEERRVQLGVSLDKLRSVLKEDAAAPPRS